MNNREELILHTYKNLAEIYALTGQYKKAMDYYNIISEQFNEQMFSLMRIADIYEKQAEYDNALKALNSAEKYLMDAKKDNKYDFYKYYIAKSWIHTNQGELDKAERELRKVLSELQNDDYEKEDDVLTYVYSTKAEISYNRGNYQKAIENYERAIEYVDEKKDFTSTAVLNANMAKVYYELRNYDKARACLRYRLSVAQKTGNRRGEAIALGGIANIYFDMQDYDRALEYYKNELSITEKLHDKKSMGMTIGNIANISYITGQYDTAVDYYKKSIDLLEKIGHKKSIAISRCNLGCVYYHKGFLTKAQKNHSIMFKIAEELKDKILIAYAHKWLGTVKREMGQFKEAIEHHKKNLNTMKKISNKMFAAEAWNDLGITYTMSGKYGEASKSFTESLDIAEKSNDSAHIMTTNYYIMKMLLMQNKLEEAEKCMKVIDEEELIDNAAPDEKIDILITFTEYYLKTGDIEKSLYYAETAIKESEKLQSELFAALAYLNLAQVKAKRESPHGKDIKKYFEEAIAILQSLESNAVYIDACVQYADYLQSIGRNNEARALLSKIK